MVEGLKVLMEWQRRQGFFALQSALFA